MIFEGVLGLHRSDAYRPPTNQTPKTFEKGALTPLTLENLKFSFGAFFLNSLEIVIFQSKMKEDNAYLAKKFSSPLCIH